MSHVAGLEVTLQDPPQGADPDQIAVWAQDQFRRIEHVLQTYGILHLREMHSEPDNPRTGLVALADGTNWNPGGTGAGFYGYYGGAWNKLG